MTKCRMRAVEYDVECKLIGKKKTMSQKLYDPDSLRVAAEAMLLHVPLTVSPVHPVEGLLHELQVHQIELEMQNEQLRQAQAALEESRDRYVDLYEFAPVGYFTLTREGMISEANLTGARLLGIERRKLLRRRFGSRVVAEQQDRWNSLFANTLQQCKTTSCELTLRKGVGEHIRAHLECLCRETNEGLKAVRIALTDITHQARAQDELREWQQVAEYASWGMAIGGVGNQTLRRVNPAFASMHGYTAEGMIGMNLIDLFAKESGPGYADFLKTLIDEGCHAFECVRLRKDGSTFPASVDASAITGFDGKTNYIVSVNDITERKDVERKMRELTAHVHTAREEEKANIAREIHDDLGGTLTALKMEAYWLAEKLSANREAEPLLGHVELISQLTDDAVNVTRRVITGLRPTILDDFGLVAALEWQCQQFAKQTGITCRVNVVEDNVELDRQYAITLYRIFQEALTNVARHSGASKVEVEYHCSDNEVMLSVSDNGRGLPEGHSASPTSFGLRGMKERVEQLCGKIAFGSGLGKGFAVTATLPLHGDRSKQEHDPYPDYR